MHITPLRSDLVSYLEKRGLLKKFEKQRMLYEENPLHPSLRTELLEPRHMRIYSFRIDRRYRAIFIYTARNRVEIVDINDHYQ